MTVAGAIEGTSVDAGTEDAVSITAGTDETESIATRTVAGVCVVAACAVTKKEKVASITMLTMADKVNFCLAISLLNIPVFMRTSILFIVFFNDFDQKILYLSRWRVNFAHSRFLEF
jgi:hypothetical protein